MGIAVDPGRTAGLEHERAEVLSLGAPPAADGSEVDGPTPAGDEGERTVGLVVAHARAIDRKQLPDLPSDRREYLLRRRPACHQRRDPPQRGLLLGQPAQTVIAQRRSPRDRPRREARSS